MKNSVQAAPLIEYAKPLSIRGDMQTETEDDASLMRDVALGDQRAFQRLMRLHLARTVCLAARVMGNTSVAEDVAQEAFIRVWKNAKNFESPEERGAKFTTWLHRIVVNLCIDEKRKQKKLVPWDWENNPEPIDEKADTEGAILMREQKGRVHEALNALPERQKIALALTFFENVPDREAASSMGVSVKALEALLVRSRRALRESLKGEKSHDED